MDRERARAAVDHVGLGLAEMAIRRPWTIVGICLSLFAVAAVGAGQLGFSNNYRVFFGEDNPELLAFERFQDTYTKNDNILFVVQPAEGEVLTPRLADALERLTEEAWKIPYAIRVDSVTNFQHSWADGDELTVEDLIVDGRTMSETELAERQAIALAEPLLRGNLLSPDGRTTGVNVTLQYPEETDQEVPKAVAAARALAADLEAEHPDIRIALSGVSMLNNAFAESGRQDAMTLFPVMFAVLVLVMVVVLRSLTGTVATLSVVAGSTLLALGAAGFVGHDLSPISATAPVVILTLAIADSIHVLLTLLGLMRTGVDKLDALRETLRVNVLPVTITSVTTIVGFLSLNLSDAPPFRHLGNLTAVGIGMALVLSLTLLPALVRLAPLRVRAGSSRLRNVDRLGRLADWVTTHHRSVLLATGAATVGAALMIPRISLNDEFVKYFDERVQFRTDTDFTVAHLNGIYLVEMSVLSEGPGGIHAPAYLDRLDAFTRWLRDQPEVRHVYSYADVIRRLNRNMHGDDPAEHRLPDDRQLAAQYLLLYELSLPYGLDLNDRVSLDKSATRLTVSLADLPTGEVRAFLERSQGWLAAHAPTSMRADPTGAAVMFAFISQRNVESMLLGNVLAVLAISALLVVALRSWGLGLLSLIPNTVPVLVTFGLWSLLVGQVGMSAAMVSATSLGIIVDDTVHFLSKYLRGRREKRLDRPAAIRYAFETVGRALIGTTLILAIGFSILTLSTFQLNAQMGLLTAIAIFAALATDLLLLPALLMIGHRPAATAELEPTTDWLPQTS